MLSPDEEEVIERLHDEINRLDGFNQRVCLENERLTDELRKANEALAEARSEIKMLKDTILRTETSRLTDAMKMLGAKPNSSEGETR